MTPFVSELSKYKFSFENVMPKDKKLSANFSLVHEDYSVFHRQSVFLGRVIFVKGSFGAAAGCFNFLRGTEMIQVSVCMKKVFYLEAIALYFFNNAFGFRSRVDDNSFQSFFTIEDTAVALVESYRKGDSFHNKPLNLN